ncbi:TIGR02678 family protein [Streptomyces sp. H10-C2]|uniref:TIGR02678 family protein n=1 Tax=unclassified Streptomyces TaxID=2593676 RepID=UPI0024B99513|nr:MULTISPECIES: TIGR02678 family protein [unclassified Streptomyces]MDJ0345970.1 TIGR02678 family protein [Streptomyces sp. PH10-H1]MDJ0373863.1 TIGR02678 family protein [Streptomyces sp. H10-C2]
MRVAENVSPLDLADYQKAVRLILRQPLITIAYPDAGALPLVRRWAGQLRADLPDTLGYKLITTADTVRLLRVQDDLDGTQPALTANGKRPFDRRRYAYLVLTLAALGRSGTQIALGELADSVAADAVRIDGLGMDTERKADRDAFVDAVTWLEARGALRTADGSAAAWANDPERAEALYDIDREVTGTVYRPSRVLQHLGSVTELLDREMPTGFAPGREAQRRTAARRARRLVLEQPAVYYADVDEALRGQLRSPALAEDLERLTGLTLERRAEGVALVDFARRLSDQHFPSGGTVQQAALLLGARIVEQAAKPRTERLSAATAAERRAALAARIDSALPERGLTGALAEFAERAETPGPLPWTDDDEASAETVYPFVTDSWLRGATKKLTAEYGKGMSGDLRDDPDRLTRLAVAQLAALRLVAPVDGGVLALPMLARYRGVTAQVRTRPRAAGSAAAPVEQPVLFATDPEDETL